jgi:site-specific DNA-methyltransferase (adenine-specific)
MYAMVSQVCLPGQSILDPFCGAGTTGVAALRHGCLFRGVELDAENVAIARARLAEVRV